MNLKTYVYTHVRTLVEWNNKQNGTYRLNGENSWRENEKKRPQPQ